ncbi:E3 ubiquitin-protein ligase NEURL1 isoform X2 [Clupea harengus]|uniref:E3 ubiquitin-protein ligase NEURL1 n=1 Tax=Clupea harengus TaxID=7950 RepID=A0A6P8ENJ6_CLUHA|nr:E3 ubiquitin-protein ligase NEURL1 isoform X2 [Clupea harengus]
MGGQITRNALYDSFSGPFPPTAHRCHHKSKRCLPLHQCGGAVPALPVSPLLFHPSAKGSQILMDLAQRAVKRQASFCNAITFSNRPIGLYEQVRLKITKKQSCWSGALRLGFTSKDPSRINPDSLPKYACPDLVSQSGFWAKALPEEFANEGSVIAFWVDKKGRVFYRINESSPMLFFSGVRTTEPLWALIDVYGLTRGVQLLESEIVPPDCLRPRSFTTARGSSLRREADESRLSVSLCDLNLQQDDSGGGGGGRGGGGGSSGTLGRGVGGGSLGGGHGNNHQHHHHLRLAPPAPVPCPIPQNSLNSQQSHLLPQALEGELRFHQLRAANVRTVDDGQTVALLRSEHSGSTSSSGGGGSSSGNAGGGGSGAGGSRERCEERALVFTERPLRPGETVFVKVTKSSPSRSGALAYGVTSCDPATLRPSDLPGNPEALVDRKEFWAVCRVPQPLQSGDILGFLVTPEGEVVLSHNGTSAGMQVCVDNSRPLWMFFGLHGAISQLRLLGSTHAGDPRGPSSPGSPSSSPQTPMGLCSSSSENAANGGCSGAFCHSAGGTTPSSPISLPKSPTFPSASAVGSWQDECSICYENMVDTVIYACGHMCLCHTCGLRLKRMANACCPICRRPIKDIIKTYRST